MSLLPKCTCPSGSPLAFADDCPKHGLGVGTTVDIPVIRSPGGPPWDSDAAKAIDQAAVANDPVMAWVTPLTDAEITDLMTLTLHGPLPRTTMNRVFATLATVPDLRKAVAVSSAGRLADYLQERARIRTLFEDVGFKVDGNDVQVPAGIPDELGDSLSETLMEAFCPAKKVGKDS